MIERNPSHLTGVDTVIRAQAEQNKAVLKEFARDLEAMRRRTQASSLPSPA